MRDRIVIGSDLNALQYAYERNTKVVLNKLSFPHKYECDYHKQAWGLLYTKLMLGGQVIGGDTVKKIRVNSDILEVVCEGQVVNETPYETLFVFNDHDILNLPEVTEEADTYDVVDVLKALSLSCPPVKKTITTDDALVGALHLFKKTSISPLELFAVSVLNKKQLNDFDYSDTMVKFKSEDLLKRNNFLGHRKSSGVERKPIELQVTERIIHKRMDIYEDTEKIKFIYGNA